MSELIAHLQEVKINPSSNKWLEVNLELLVHENEMPALREFLASRSNIHDRIKISLPEEPTVITATESVAIATSKDIQGEHAGRW